MNTSLLRLRWVALFIFVVIRCKTAVAQVEPAFMVKRDVQVERNFGGYYSLTADLDQLPVGKHGKVLLTIHNPFDEDISTGGQFSGCGCLKITLSDAVLSAHGLVTAELELATPAKSIQEKIVVPFDIALDKRSIASGVRCKLTYRLAGLVAFREPLAILQIAPNDLKAQLRVPLIINPPSSPAGVEVLANGDFSQSKVEIVRADDGGFYARLSWEAIDPLRANLTGQIVARDRETGIEDSVICVIKAEANIQLAPTPLRFVSLKDGTFEAKAVVRIKRAQQLDSSKQRIPGAADSPKVNSTLKGAVVTHKIQSLSSEVFRVVFTANPKGELAVPLADTYEQLEFTLSVGDEKFQLDCPVVFSSH